MASKLRRIYGYVGEITLTGGDGTDTPAQLQIVTRIPWRYGRRTAETGCSWVFVRVQAFVSKALFSSPAQIIKLGQCISGFAEPSSGDSKSCQLVGWDVCSIDEWRTAAPQTIPSSFDLTSNRGFYSFCFGPPPIHCGYGPPVRNSAAERRQLLVYEIAACLPRCFLPGPHWRHVRCSVQSEPSCSTTPDTPTLGPVPAVWRGCYDGGACPPPTCSRTFPGAWCLPF